MGIQTSPLAYQHTTSKPSRFSAKQVQPLGALGLFTSAQNKVDTTLTDSVHFSARPAEPPVPDSFWEQVKRPSWDALPQAFPYVIQTEENERYRRAVVYDKNDEPIEFPVGDSASNFQTIFITEFGKKPLQVTIESQSMDKKPAPKELPRILQEADQVKSWYKPKLTEQPSSERKRAFYTDQSWNQWWVDRLRQENLSDADKGCRLLKLKDGNRLLGLLYLEDCRTDSWDGRPVSLIRGLRVAPLANQDLMSEQTARSAQYQGVGTALITQAILESLKHPQSEGLGVTASPGTEEYYQTLFGAPKTLRQHGDDPSSQKRAYFVLKHDNAFDKALAQFDRYDQLFYQWYQQRQKEIPPERLF